MNLSNHTKLRTFWVLLNTPGQAIMATLRKNAIRSPFTCDEAVQEHANVKLKPGWLPDAPHAINTTTK